MGQNHAGRQFLSKPMSGMFDYTHENHFKWGFNGEWFQLPDKALGGGQSYNVAFGQCQNILVDFHAACLDAARLIQDKATLPINLALSGGYDSEIALRSFVEAGIPLTAYTARFTDGSNQTDVLDAQAVAQTHGVPWKPVDLNVLRFWEQNFESYAERYDTMSPHFMVHIWLASQLDGHFVSGGGDPFAVNRSYTISPISRWHLHFRARQMSTTRYCLSENREASPLFFHYTPELMYTAFANPHVAHFLQYGLAMGMNELSNFKPYFYGQYFPTQLVRTKRTGFETIATVDDEYRAKLKALTRSTNPECIVRLDHALDHFQRRYEYWFPWRPTREDDRLYSEN